MLVGTSRKSFLGKIAPERDGSDAPVDERLEASLATATWAMLAGASMVRVHDVRTDGAGGDARGIGSIDRLDWIGSMENGPDCEQRFRRHGIGHESAGSVISSQLFGGGEVDPERKRMRGKWAAGIPPRNFTWVIQDQLAMSERPGGFAPHHRRVRRQEEIIWLRVQGFSRIVSPAPLARTTCRPTSRARSPLPTSRSRRPATHATL